MRDHVFLKVMPKRGIVRFGKQGKLSSRYIEPFEVLERVGIVSYQLAIPPCLSSMLWKYILDSTHVGDWGELVVDIDRTFEEGPMRILES